MSDNKSQFEMTYPVAKIKLVLDYNTPDMYSRDYLQSKYIKF